jgi:hypothetical protein
VIVEEVMSCPLPGEPFFGQDGNYRSGLDPEYVVVDSGPAADKVTVDRATGLMWAYHQADRPMTFAEALSYAQELDLGGFRDWRIPSITELLSIVCYGRGSPKIDTEAFAITFPLPEHSRRPLTVFLSTTLPKTGGSPHGICFSRGELSAGMSLEHLVRVVRTLSEKVEPGDINGDGALDISDAVSLLQYLFLGGARPAPVTKGEGLPATRTCPTDDADCLARRELDPSGKPRDFEIVKPAPADPRTWYTIDHVTNLMWQFSESQEMKTWKEALAYAESLELGGFSDWRLPNVKELQSITDYSTQFGDYAPGPDDFFGSESLIQESRDHWTFWTSTADLSRSPGRKVTPFAVLMDCGLIFTVDLDDPQWVRVVRTLP